MRLASQSRQRLVHAYQLALFRRFASLVIPAPKDGAVLKWFVKPGDRVRQFDNLCEFSADGQTIEVSSRADGVVTTILSTTPGQLVKSGASLVSLNADEKKGLKKFLLADPGEGTAEIEMVKWHVKPGDVVRQSDLICEATTDKASLEYKSPWDGVIKELYYQVGQVAPVGTHLFSIETADGGGDATPASPACPIAAAAASASSSVNGTAAAAAPSTPVPASKVLAAPAARALAREHKFNLADVPATGNGGKVVTKEDALNFIAGKSASPITTLEAPQPTPAVPSAPPAAAILQEDKRVPVTGAMKVMVQTMNYANTVPQFGFCDEIICDKLVEIRKQAKSLADKKGIKLSYLPFIMKAMSNALKEFPSLNAHVLDPECTEVIYKASHNIGLAMDTPRGLLVPNVKNVQNLSIMAIAAELDRLQKLGPKLGKADLTGGTISISNIGSIGGTYAKPLLLKPEVMICALGKMQVVPRFDANMNVKAVTIMNASWSADHRVVDGATCARFSNLWKSYLENPLSMLLE